MSSAQVSGSGTKVTALADLTVWQLPSLPPHFWQLAHICTWQHTPSMQKGAVEMQLLF